MPIIIDANCIVNVFDKHSSKHEEFKPVLEWIISGKGKMVYGGTKYHEELKSLSRYIRLIRRLKESNKAVEGDRTQIDEYQKIVESRNNDKDFDDPHLIAISVITKCLLICSEDKRSIKHIKDKKYYPDSFKNTHSYYTSSRNKNLLRDNYVHNTFKPLEKMSKTTQQQILLSLNINN